MVELVPYYICSLLSERSVWAVPVAVVTLYSFYEVGYIFNDRVSIQTEKNPTLRVGFEGIRPDLFTLCRTVLTSAMVFYAALTTGANRYNVILIATSVIVTFALHNKIYVARYRMTTFIILNVLKIYFVISLLGLDEILVFGFLPYIAIKWLNYMRVKRLVCLSPDEEAALFLPISLAFAVPIVYIDVRLLFVAAPIIILYNRKIIKNLIAAG